MSLLKCWKAFIADIESYLKDDNGNKSTVRLIWFVWSIGVFFVWMSACIYKRDIVNVPEVVAGLVLGLGGVKAYQKKIETPPVQWLKEPEKEDKGIKV